MRVAFLSERASYLDAVSQSQSAIARTQEQIATGRKFTTAGQDPVAATQSLSIETLLANYERYDRNATLAANRLGFEETALKGANEVLMRVRELVLQAANGPQSAEARAAIAAEVRERLDELVATANTRDGNGEYLFAGSATRTQPFVQTGGAVAYQGDQGRRLQQIAEDQWVADGDSGTAVFELIRNGNGTFNVTQAAGNAGTVRMGPFTLTDATQYDAGSYRIVFIAPDAWEARDAANAVVAGGAYRPGDAVSFRGMSIGFTGAPAAGDTFNVEPSANQSAFATIERLLATLARPDGTDADRAALSNALSNALVDIDQAIGNVLDVRASLGARLSVIESRQSQNEDATVELKGALSGLRDTDYAAALTLLEQQLTALAAAQKSYVRAEGLSLFDYL
jgi:flagellar hook-associated protein 3 FlgL